MLLTIPITMGGVPSSLMRRFFLSSFALLFLFFWLLLHRSGRGAELPQQYKDIIQNAIDGIQLPLDTHLLAEYETELRKQPQSAGLTKLLQRPEASELIRQHEGLGLTKEEVLSETIRILEEYTRADLLWVKYGKVDQQRRLFEKEYISQSKLPGADAIYGGTLSHLSVNTFRGWGHSSALSSTSESKIEGVKEKAHTYDPYHKTDLAERVIACDGPDGKPLDDVRVFAGTPVDFPAPSFGSYDVLGLDDNLCFERETRMGPYGYKNTSAWAGVDWGKLQDTCVQKNGKRFKAAATKNPYLDLYEDKASAGGSTSARDASTGISSRRRRSLASWFRGGDDSAAAETPSKTDLLGRENRTAVLLRAWSGKKYSDDDVLMIRSLVAELGLRTGGQYQVFLLVHEKDNDANIWKDAKTYDKAVRAAVPAEFVNMTLLWNDHQTQSVYRKLYPTVSVVHTAQWLSVQLFSQSHPEFEFVWNVELDSRNTGHHYSLLEALAGFAREQPRRGLWERNERYYIPAAHGDYRSDFRKDTWNRAGPGVWGPPAEVAGYVRPVGPAPPTRWPVNDNYQWGVGEEADMITLGPIVDAPETAWIIKNQVWGYNGTDTPRRGTIITQARVSKRLLDVMHVENLRGNHVSSEMTPQTVALHHGLKAVYAPMPVFMDRPWKGADLERWFNCGFRCGRRSEEDTLGSPLGWGKEGRFAGSTWYYRATPPQRLYRNWLGLEDAGLGGAEWEEKNGRTCLPPVLLHPVKNVE